MAAPAPDTVLVFRFGAVGDIVLTSAAVEALARAWPETRICYVTKAGFVPLVARDPNIHEVVGLERGESVWALRRRLAALSPGAVLDLHGKARGFLLRGVAPRGRRVVWSKRGLADEVGVRLRLRTYHAEMMIAERYHAAVERLVGRKLEQGRMRLHLDPAAGARLDEILAAAGADRSRPVIGMSPGAMWETKRWPPERFGQLAALAAAAGFQVMLHGSAAEAEVTARVAAAAAPGVVDLAGKLALAELAAAIDRCAAFVANDSGPMHMARALGVPTVALFGSTDPGQFDFTGHALMYAAPPCSPCSLYGLRRCPKGHLRCLLDIDAEDVWPALAKLAGGRRRELVSG